MHVTETAKGPFVEPSVRSLQLARRLSKKGGRAVAHMTPWERPAFPTPGGRRKKFCSRLIFDVPILQRNFYIFGIRYP